MQRVNEFQLYEVAIHVHPLTQIPNKVKYSAVWISWMDAKTAIYRLFTMRTLEVCFETANELYLALLAIVPDDFNAAAAKLPQDETTEPDIEWSHIHKIRTLAEKFETVLSAELSNSDTYFVSPKGTHKTSVLLQYAHRDLPASIRKEVPEVTSDFDEAGRCLLFDNSTAVGFHLLRATEAVIRRYYKQVTGVEPKTKFRNWGAYIKRLNEKAASPKITRYLDHIREHYRNPILHPEENLSPEDAQVLYGVCVSAITMMAQEMDALAKKSAAPLPFPTTGAIAVSAGDKA